MSQDSRGRRVPWPERQQAWGVAAWTESGFISWCYGDGPEGWERMTKRAANLSALMSNNGLRGGRYMPLPIPGNKIADKNYADKDMIPYVEGPWSKECNELFIRVSKLLEEKPDLDYHELPHLGEAPTS